jgi:hypothetical protein
MRYRIAGDLRADEGLNHIDEILVAEKIEGRSASCIADVRDAIDLLTFICETCEARLKRFTFMERGDLALGVQVAGDLIYDEVVRLYQRCEVAIGEGTLDDDVAFFLIEGEVLICYTHKVSPLVSLTVMTFRLMLRGTDQTLDLLASTAAPESRRRSRRRRIVPFDAATVPHRTNSLFFRTLMHFFGLPCPLGKGGILTRLLAGKVQEAGL